MGISNKDEKKYNEFEQDSLGGDVVENNSVLKSDWVTTINAIDDILMIISAEHRILDINQSGLKLLGLKYDEVVGKKCYEIIHQNEKMSKQCIFCQNTVGKDAKALERVEKIRGRYFAIKCTPIFDDDGNLIKFVDIKHDITELKLKEDELENKNYELMAIIDEINNIK